MTKQIFKNFIVSTFKNENLTIKVTETSREYLKSLDNNQLNTEIRYLLDCIGLSVVVINGYHYLQYNIYPDIMFDIGFIDNLVMKFEKLINGNLKNDCDKHVNYLKLESIKCKKEIFSLQEDIENGY